MTPRDFIEKAFGILAGTIDVKLDYTLPTLQYVGRVRELEYACGVDKNTFYALNAFATCPRSYMLRYLLSKPLSIPFYEQVQEVVREVIADEATGRIRRGEMSSRFAKLYDELVTGPFPIHQQTVNWPESWKRAVGDYMAKYNPEWEQRGWRVKDAYIPVSVVVAGGQIYGAIDLLLKNEAGEYAIVVHDAGGTVYRAKRTGEIKELIETKRDIEDLKRRAYVYGVGLSQSNPECAGKLREIIFNLYRPKSKDPFETVFQWNENDCANALKWVNWASELIVQAAEDRDWPAAELLRSGSGGAAKPDDDYCRERCTSCLRCHWAGMHPEVLKAFTDVTKVTSLPQKYIGVKIRLRDDLDKSQPILDYPKEVTLDDGKSRGASKLKAVLQKMGLKLIGDLDRLRISDFFATPNFGETKVELILKLFYEAL